MVRYFLSQLTNRTSIPPGSLLIAHLSIAHGGLDLMNTHTQALPDFILTMRQATQYAKNELLLPPSKPTCMIPVMLHTLFHGQTNKTSQNLQDLYCLLPDVAIVGTHICCLNPADFFLAHDLFKSSQDCLKQAANQLSPKHHWEAIAQDIHDQDPHIFQSITHHWHESQHTFLLTPQQPLHRQSQDLSF